MKNKKIKSLMVREEKKNAAVLQTIGDYIISWENFRP